MCVCVCVCAEGERKKHLFLIDIDLKKKKEGEKRNLARYSLALPVLQIKMRIEVDEDPLVRTRRGYHPRASLRGGIRHGVSGRGEVVGV